MTLTQTDITPRERGAEMSVLRAVRKRKKVRKLGRVEIMRREDYADLELDAKVELIRSLVPLGLMHVEELLDDVRPQLVPIAMPDSVGHRTDHVDPWNEGLSPRTASVVRHK